MKGGLTKRQIKKIWTMAYRYKIDPEHLRLAVKSVTGHESIRSLSKRKASRFIEEITAKGGVEAFSQGAFLFDRGTRAQLLLIRELGTQSGWNEKQVTGLARRMYGVSSVEHLTVKQASGVIEALKAITLRKAG